MWATDKQNSPADVTGFHWYNNEVNTVAVVHSLKHAVPHDIE